MKKLSVKAAASLLIMLALMLSLIGCSGGESTGTKAGATEIPSPAPIAEAGAEASETPQNEEELDLGGEAFETSDELIAEFHAIQVMAKALISDVGVIADMYDFVAGKSTLLRVGFEEAVDIEQDGSMVVTVFHNGEEIAELLPINSGESNVAYFMPRSIGDVNNWQKGVYAFELSYNGMTATRRISMREAKKIKVLAVPVIANYGGRVVSCEGEWQTAIQFTRDTYPLADNGLEYVLGNEIDLSDDRYDLMTDDGCYNVWEALTGLQTPGEDYTLILGFVRERQGEDATLQGYTYGRPANVITESDGDMQPTVAHEIAHCYDLGDEYPGGSLNQLTNPPPYGMEGSDYNDRDETTVGMKEAIRWASEFSEGQNPSSGTVVYPNQYPVNVRELKLLQNPGSFMGSGSDHIEDYWITSVIWSHLYKALVSGQESGGAQAENDGLSAGEAQCPFCYEEVDWENSAYYDACLECGEYTQLSGYGAENFSCEYCETENEVDGNSVIVVCFNCEEEFALASLLDAANQSAKTTAKMKSTEPEKMRVIDITGTIRENGAFQATPWYSYEGDSSMLDVKRSGRYSVVMEDASGKKLSVQYFDANYYADAHQRVKRDMAALDITLRYVKDTAKIKIMEGEKEIFSQAVSANAPEIAFVGIEEYQSFGGKAEIKWEGADADGDPVYYELWYCPSEEEYIHLASNIKDNSYTVDFNTLPGTEEGYFYLYATDGVNTVEADSEWVKVEYKAPEIISSQESIPEYKITDEIVFDADIYDKQDGWLYDEENVTWTLKGREFMAGSCLWVFPYELTPGEHTFTLTAVNSRGKEAAKDVTFKILGDESALPDDWSKEDIKAALSNGFVAPLANVNSSITRGQFAKLMANLYWNVWEEGSPEPEYEEGVVKDCGQDDYDQFLMVALGVMEAPNGRFHPNGNVTEEEAAVIMYQLCAIADPNVAEPTENRAEMVEICLNSEVMEKSGNNSYSPQKNITGRLALVRCNRLYQIIFGE